MRTDLLALLLASGAALAPSPVAADESEARLADSVRATAHLLANELVVGARFDVRVDVAFEEGFDPAAAGMPGLLLQLDVPPSLRLEGEVLDEYEELARNGFVDEPHERLLEELPATIGVELVAPPAADATLGLNLVGYLRAADGRVEFLRKRLELPLVPGAASLEVPATRSNWGADEALLQLGDRAPDFTLPRADGSELRLSSMLGEGRVLVVTWRAHW